MTIDFHALLEDTKAIITQNDGLNKMCALLKSRVPHYNWVGIYVMNNTDLMLELGAFAGAETEHTRIPFGRGICGQVAVSGQTFVVPDVWQQDNYLACSLETKAEIVLPIYQGDVLVAQLDIDSHVANPFTTEDENFLNEVCRLCAPLVVPIA